MAHCNTVFFKILKLGSRLDFESLAMRHHSDRSFRKASFWSKFAEMTLAQLSDRFSLQDTVDKMKAESHQLCPLASISLTHTTLARGNEYKPYQFYLELFARLPTRRLSKPQGCDRYRDVQAGKHHAFITNHLKLTAITIVSVYKI